MNFDKLNQRFSKIREEWQQDTQIDFQFKNKEYSEDLARLALEIPFQHNKYLNHMTDFYGYFVRSKDIKKHHIWSKLPI